MPMNPRLLRPTSSSVHPEANAWRTAVVANGGSVSASTMKAVSTFCAAINAAGIRDRFFRLNLFCGNSDASLNAVRTPLYRGPSLGGTQYGGTTDTNNNFVAGDYAETGASGGLLGNGTSKYLDTGLTVADVGNTGHHGFYHDNAGGTTVSRAIGGATNNARSQRFVNFSLGALNRFDATYGVNQTAVDSGVSAGFQIATRRSATDFEHYSQGSSVATNTTNTSVTAVSINFGVFAVLGASDTNTVDTAFGYWADRIKGYSFGLALTVSQVASYQAAMQAFQTALGRQA